MSSLEKHNVNVAGSGRQTMLFAHGFGCDQNMWRFVAPAFADRYRTVLFDHVGAGKSDLRRLRPRALRDARTATRTTCWRSARRSGHARRDFCRSFGERDDRHARGDRGAVALPQAGSRGPVAVLHRRRRLRRRIQSRRRSRSCSNFSTATISAGRARWRRRSWATPIGPSSGEELHEQFLPHRSRDREALRARHVSFRQSCRRAARAAGMPDPPVLVRRHRASTPSASICIATCRGAGSCSDEGDRALPEPECARRNDRRDRRISRRLSA